MASFPLLRTACMWIRRASADGLFVRTPTFATAHPVDWLERHAAARCCSGGVPPGPPVATGDCLATEAGRLSHICKDSFQYNHPKNNVNSDVIFYVKITTLFF